MVCQSCRKATRLENQDTGQYYAGNANGIVMDLEDIVIEKEGANSMHRHACSFCRDDGVIASTFCRDCRVYMCRLCDHGHSQIRVFTKHDTRTIEDNHWQRTLAEGATARSPSLVHQLLKNEKREFFCPDLIFCEDCALSKNCPHVF